MHLITKFPTYSDGTLYAALEREFRTGVQLYKATEENREKAAAERATQMRGSREIPGLGRHVTSMPAKEYFNLVRRHGAAEIGSKEFLKYHQKKFPHLTTGRI